MSNIFSEQYEIKTIKDTENVLRSLGIQKPIKNNKKISYYNFPVAFDIETTSFVHSNGQKSAIMYVWTLSINGKIIMGRTWEEFIECCKIIAKWFNTGDEKRLIIYIHNLSFEFQFLHKYFNFTKVFSLKKRVPIQAITDLGIEFRCSYKLSGYSLKTLGKNLTKYKIEKLSGDLDYNLPRNKKTILTEKEIRYCVNDVLVVTAYIQEYIERVGNIYDIPLTKTGAVRKLARNYCFYNNGRKKENRDTLQKYRKFIRGLILEENEYNLLRKAFMGGFTHANALYSRQIVENVRSYDFTSSYPAVMLSEKFPMSSPKKVIIKSDEEFRKYLRTCCCFFDIEIEGLQPLVYFENYLSKSHCCELKGIVENNGRIVSAEHLKTTVTEQDFYIIEKYYKWDKLLISNFHYMLKGYLPKNFILAILDMYEAKTTLKDVEGREQEYLVAKENLNSLYGMSVTDICREEIIYSPFEWTGKKPDITKAITKENKSLKRFLYYPWGVWVTAYARFNLFTAITVLKDDYVYADTDSVKIRNYEKHLDYFEAYNRAIISKIERAMKFHNINPERTRPKNIKGEVKQIGIWEDEGLYNRFKTLGAKRYMVEKNGKINITVSGLNKQTCVPYLLEKYGDKIFEAFDDDLYIPPEYTGKLTHTYIDEPIDGYMTDYQGHTVHYHEESCIHLQPAEYSLSIAEMYIKYLLGIEDIEI